MVKIWGFVPGRRRHFCLYFYIQKSLTAVSEIFVASTHTLIQWLILNTNFCSTTRVTVHSNCLWHTLYYHSMVLEIRDIFTFTFTFTFTFNIMGLKQIHPFLQSGKFSFHYCNWEVTCRYTSQTGWITRTLLLYIIILQSVYSIFILQGLSRN